MAATTGSLGLFLQVAEPFNADENISLVMQGASGTGVFDAADLYASGDNGYSINIPLSIDGGLIGDTVRNVNLFAEGRAHSAEAASDLYLQNDQSGVALSAPLFVAGSGVGDGALPYEKGLSLFLRRPVTDAVFLYIQAPGTPDNEQVPLFVQANIVSSGVISLAVPNVVGSESHSARLYTHGF